MSELELIAPPPHVERTAGLAGQPFPSTPGRAMLDGGLAVFAAAEQDLSAA